MKRFRVIKHKKSWYGFEVPLLPIPCREAGTYYTSPPVCSETVCVTELACHEPP